MTINVKLKRR